MGKTSKIKKLAAAMTCVAATTTAILAAPFVAIDATGASLAVTAGASTLAAGCGVYCMSKWSPFAKVFGIKDDRFDLKCKDLSMEELKRLYKGECFKSGSAFVGVFVDGTLAFAIPTMLLGAAISVRQLHLTIRKKNMLKKIARECHNSSFDDMRRRKRRYTCGALWKILLYLVCLGRGDVIDAAQYFQDGFAEFLLPGSEVDVVTGLELEYESFSNAPGVKELQILSTMPSDFVKDVTGFSNDLANNGLNPDHNLTWAHLRQQQVLLGPEIALVAVADSFSPSMVALDSGGERVHREVTERRRPTPVVNCR